MQLQLLHVLSTELESKTRLPALDDVTWSGRSFMWTRKSSGPSIVPWGTPDITFVSEEDSPSTTTFISLLHKNDAIHECNLPLIPYDSSLCSSFLWGTVSNALLKSKMATSVWMPFSTFLALCYCICDTLHWKAFTAASLSISKYCSIISFCDTLEFSTCVKCVWNFQIITF